MKPIGETYLVKCEIEPITNDGGILIVNSKNSNYSDTFWKGTIIGYGTKIDESDPDLLPIGEKVVMDPLDKDKTKIVLKGVIFYSISKDKILAVLED